MDSAEAKKLIDGLGLTKREERTLRYLAGLGRPEPRGRIDRFLQRPLKGFMGALLVAAVHTFAVSVAYLILRYFDYISTRIMPLFSTAISLLILAFLFVDHVVCRRLVRKLYRSLGRSSAPPLVERSD